MVVLVYGGKNTAGVLGKVLKGEPSNGCWYVLKFTSFPAVYHGTTRKFTYIHREGASTVAQGVNSRRIGSTEVAFRSIVWVITNLQ